MIPSRSGEVRVRFLRIRLAGYTLATVCAALPLDRSESRGSREGNVDLAEVPRYGFDVEVVTPGGTDSGELIAVGTHHVWLVVGEMGELRQVPRSRIQWIGVEHGPRVRGAQIDQLYQFARFPQGLPGGHGSHLTPREPPPVDPRLGPPSGDPVDPYEDELRGPGTEPTPIPTTM